MTSPPGEARVLAEIEAGLRADYPRLTALFESFSQADPVPQAASPPVERQRRGKGRLARLLIALLLAAVLGAGGVALSAVGAYGGVAGLADRAATDVQRWGSEQVHDLQMWICQPTCLRYQPGWARR